jgi:glycosyltransferase involved in cell wall biosynthesis
LTILYIHQLFKTPTEGGGIRSWFLAKALVDAGHTVEMISSHNKKAGLEIIDGIRVHYLRIPYDNSYGFFRRLWAYGLFVLKARQIARKIGTADLAYVMTTPLTTGFIATWIKRRLNIPYYFEVGDLWPDVPVEMGVIGNPILKKWLFRKEKEFYEQAEKVIALSPDIASNIRTKTVTPVEVIPNMADTAFFTPTFRTVEITLENPLKILYCGAHGRANQLEFLIDAARAVQSLPIRFTLMGAGSEKKRIFQLATELTNITFLPHGSKEDVREQLAQHDALYISFQNLPMLHTGSPNKFFDALAAGKMIISNLGGWTAELIKEHQLGFAYSGAHPEQFCASIERYLNQACVREAQENAHRLSTAYSLEMLSAQVIASVENH